MKEGGYVMSADFTGKHPPDVEGCTVALVCCVHGYKDDTDEAESEAAYGFVALLKERTATTTAKALDEFDSELRRLAGTSGTGSREVPVSSA